MAKDYNRNPYTFSETMTGPEIAESALNAFLWADRNCSTSYGRRRRSKNATYRNAYAALIARGYSEFDAKMVLKDAHDLYKLEKLYNNSIDEEDDE